VFVIVFHLTYRPRRAKGILLTDDLPIGLPTVCGPPYDELLGTLALLFEEHEPNPVQSLGWIKHEPNDLRARLRGPPTSMPAREQRGFNGESRILGGDLHLGNMFHIEPRRTRG
jgi:hypothetical protein